MFWTKHKPSREKHAGYEGQTCPESHWVREEGKGFLVSYQILQQRNHQFGWVRKLGGSTNVVKIVHLPQWEDRGHSLGSPSWRKACNPPSTVFCPQQEALANLHQGFKRNMAPAFRDPVVRCGRALTVFRDLWELEVCLETSFGDRSFRGTGEELLAYLKQVQIKPIISRQPLSVWRPSLSLAM